MFNQNWFINGVATGFGRIMTRKLLAQGARVAGTVQSKDTLVDMRHAYGHRLWLAYLDPADTESICDIVDEAFWELGTIHVVVDLLGSSHLQRAVLLHHHRQGSGCLLSTGYEGEFSSRQLLQTKPDRDDHAMPPALAYGLSEWTSAI
jgi:NAD(P)-dependent dehydrogenase (short-subunit alcohol dehydrogenase family)